MLLESLVAAQASAASLRAGPRGFAACSASAAVGLALLPGAGEESDTVRELPLLPTGLAADPELWEAAVEEGLSADGPVAEPLATDDWFAIFPVAEAGPCGCDAN